MRSGLTLALVCALGAVTGPAHAGGAGTEVGRDGGGPYRVVYLDARSERWQVASHHATYDDAFRASVDTINRDEARTKQNVHVVGRAGAERAQTLAAIGDNGFYVDRNATGYADYLGPLFVADRRAWTAGMRVLDAGAGEAIMLRQLVAERGGRDLPELVATSVKRPALAAAELAGIDYREGELGGDGGFERALGHGRFDRIVDVYGASHYGERFDRVIEGYGRLLRHGGRVFLHLPPAALYLEGPDGRAIDTVEWLGRLGGLRVVYARPNERQGLAIVLERTRGRLRVPRLELTDYHDAAPPVRFYRDLDPASSRLGRWLRLRRIERRSSRELARLGDVAALAIDPKAPRRGWPGARRH